MRTMWLVPAFALILPVAGCDTTQPTDAGERLVSIAMTGNGRVAKWNVWDVWIDVDGNCQINEPPDFKASYLYCQELPAFDTTVPWPYSAEISIIRSGTTTEEVIATTIGTANEFSNLSFYDERVIQQLPNQGCSGIPNGELRVNGRQVSAAHREVMEKCLGAQDLLSVNVLGQPDHFDVAARPGDTIVFRARKQRQDFAGPYANIVVGSVDQLAVVTLDGVEVDPQGDIATGSEDGGGISISLRLR